MWMKRGVIGQVLLMVVMVFAAGCKVFEPRPPAGMVALEAEVSEETFTSVEQAGTAELWDEVVAAAEADGLNRVVMLDHGRAALEARINLIRSARESIKISTYIWENDEVSRLLIWELVRAAKQRGVKVQVVTDQWGSWGGAEVTAAVALVDPNVAHRVYNPTADSVGPGTMAALGAGLANLDKMNTRLHAKMMIFDDKVALIGGRNIANKYYDFHIGMNYLDRDIIFVGKEVEAAVRSFDEIWNCDWAIDARYLKDVAPIIEKYKGTEFQYTRSDFEFYGLFDEVEANASDAGYVSKVYIEPMLVVDKARWVCDHPLKAEDRKRRKELDSESAKVLAEIVEGAERLLVMQSPYLVFLSPGRKWFAQRVKERQGLRIRVSTNSLAAADHATVYGALYRYKRAYVQDMGFELWEMKPIAQDIDRWMDYESLLERRPTPEEVKGWALEPFFIDERLRPYEVRGEDGEVVKSDRRVNEHTQTAVWLCIHSKSMVADDEVALVGSINLDPRSFNINVENGLVVYDQEFAVALRESIERTMVPRNAYLQALRPEPGRHEGMTRFSEWFLIDLWPTRAVTGFELKEGARPVGYGDEAFYENWEAVGDFPLVRNSSGRINKASNSKAFGIVVYPFY